MSFLFFVILRLCIWFWGHAELSPSLNSHCNLRYVFYIQRITNLVVRLVRASVLLLTGW